MMNETRRQIRAMAVDMDAEQSEAWARQQVETVDCGDARRAARLVKLLGAMMRHPGQSLPQQCGQEAPLKAAYRLLECADLQPEAIVQSAAAATLADLQRHALPEVLLAVQDTTTLNFTTHEALEGRGPISNHQKTQGFMAHSTLLLGEETLVHGLLECEVYARDAQAQRARKSGERNRQSAAQKESQRWVRSLQQSAQLCALLPQAQAIVNVADREADMYELFLEAERLGAQHAGRVHLLVRAQHDRELQQLQGRLWDHLEAQPAQLCWELCLPAPKGIHGTQVRQVEAVWQQVSLAVPAHQQKYQGHEQPVNLSVVMVREPAPPPGQKALEWVLLSTWPVSDASQARRVVGWYARRWQIEVMHRVWKSGCAVEARQLRQARAAQVMIVLDLLTAVRLLSLLSVARHHPQTSAADWLSHAQQSVLKARFALRTHDILTMDQAVRCIAQLGGHGAAPSRPAPGAQALWRGWLRLQDMTEGWLLSNPSQKCG
jgi:Transposase DNA-binding/Transposase DDE domain